MFSIGGEVEMIKKGLFFLIFGLVLTTHVLAQSLAILPSRQAIPASFPSTNTPPPPFNFNA